MSSLTKTNSWLVGDKATVGYKDDKGQTLGTCPLTTLAKSCFEAIRTGQHFEIYMSGAETAPVKLVLSRNRRSVVVRGCFGEFFGLVGLRYLAEKINNVIRGWAQNFEIQLVQLNFTDQLPTADAGLLGSQVGGEGQ
jgi:hypothetical protein